MHNFILQDLLVLKYVIKDERITLQLNILNSGIGSTVTSKTCQQELIQGCRAYSTLTKDTK